jgi:hypothetical protein
MDVSERILEVPGRLGIPAPPADVLVDRRRRLGMAKPALSPKGNRPLAA